MLKMAPRRLGEILINLKKIIAFSFYEKKTPGRKRKAAGTSDEVFIRELRKWVC